LLSLRSAVAALAVAGAVAAAPAAANAATGYNAQDIGSGKHVTSSATQYANGLMMLDSFAKNDNWFYGMRPKTLIVSVDANNNAIWVSHEFDSATVCGVMDPSCASQRRETFSEAEPAAIGRNAVRLDIYHADNPNYVNLRNQLIDVIKAGADVAQEVKDAWNQLQKS
jgi:hypothetical protein